MDILSSLYHLIQADLRERVRSNSFLIVVGATIFLGYLLVPSSEASYLAGVLPHSSGDSGQVDYFRGVYNSAWIGSMVAMMTAMILSLPGFYLVKNNISRDKWTGMGEILATTPLSKSVYIIGKWLSNLGILGLWILILGLASMVMQFLRAEVLEIQIIKLTTPFVMLALPVAALVSALAILFEVIPLLRSGLGNVVYFFVWFGGLVLVMDNNLFGWELVFTSVEAAAQADFPLAEHTSIGINPVQGPLQTFTWVGVPWTEAFLYTQAIWIGIAVGITLLSVLFFNRFDPASEGFRPISAVAGALVRSHIEANSPLESDDFPLLPEVEEDVQGSLDRVRLVSESTVTVQFQGWQVFLAELRLAMKGHRWWWYLIAIGIWAGTLLSPIEVARRFFYPLAWIWPLLIWSRLGTREIHFNTAPIIFSTPHPLRRQLFPAWLAGLSIAVILGSGMAFRFVLGGDYLSLLVWAAGAVFIPSLAICLGCWSRSAKLFEVVYTGLWCFGPMGKLLFFDFMGVWPATVESSIPGIYLSAAIALIGLAFQGRRRQFAS